MKPEEPPLITSREPGSAESSEQGVPDAGYIAPLFQEGLTSQMSGFSCQEQVNPDLEAFRQEWKQEIGIKEGSSRGAAVSERNVEEEAKSLFLRGVESEKRGDMSEAVRQYASAMKLVPDIERRVHPHNPAPRARSTSRVRAGSTPLAATGNDLVHSFQKRIAERGQLFLPTSEDSCHMDRLPVEILHLIMRYIVSSEMNLRHLEILSEVSAMMYLLARDDDLWRRIHARSTGEAPVRDDISPLPWRERYLSSPHLQFEGIYISKITYIRHGEQQFQDNNYRPWHTVTYFRMMRFFPDGKALMMTSSESPQSCASLLKSRVPPKNDTAICTGTWYQDGEEIVMKVRRECAAPPKPSRYTRRVPLAEYGVQRHEFAVRLRLCPLKVAGRWSLHWLENLCIVTYLDGRKNTSDLEADKNPQDFPPLRFYRVKMFSDVPSDRF